MLFNRDWRNRRKLYPLYAELRHHFSIVMETLSHTSLIPLGPWCYFENPNKTGFYHQSYRCYLEVEIQSAYLVIILGVRNFTSGSSQTFENFSNKYILTAITNNDEGVQQRIRVNEVHNYEASRLCSETLQAVIKLDALIKETEEKKKKITEAFEKTETDFLLPFREELKNKNTSDTITAFCVKESGQSNIVKEEL